MKKLFLTVFALLIASNVLAEGALKFGVAPSNPNSRDSLGVLLGFLSERTGQKFELVEIDYDQLLNKIAEGEVSFADLTPSAVATAEQKFGDKIKYVVTVATRNGADFKVFQKRQKKADAEQVHDLPQISLDWDCGCQPSSLQCHYLHCNPLRRGRP